METKIILMLNSTELQKLGYTHTEAYEMMQRLSSALPTKSITIMVQYERGGHLLEAPRSIRHVRLDDVLRLCDERIKNVRNIKSVNVEMWRESKLKLATINQE